MWYDSTRVYIGIQFVSLSFCKKELLNTWLISCFTMGYTSTERDFIKASRKGKSSDIRNSKVNQNASYNGYYNYNVWNVKLWSDNEYDIYQKQQKLFEEYRTKKISEKKFYQGINQIGRSAHSRSDVHKEKLSNKEISELRKAYLDDYKEYKEYNDLKENQYDVKLIDDGSLDTVVEVNGKQIRYDTEFGSQFRNKKTGGITKKGWEELKEQAIKDFEGQDIEIETDS